MKNLRTPSRNPVICLLALSLLLSACRTVPLNSSSWEEDLEIMKQILPRNHVNLFYEMKLSQWEDEIDALQKRVSEMPRAQIIAEIKRILTMAGDSHTDLALSEEKRFPLELFDFENGLYVTGIDPAYENFLGTRLVAVEDIPIEEVLSVLSQVIPHENQSRFQDQFPQLLPVAPLLAGLNLVAEEDSARFIFENEQGSRSQATLTAREASEGELARTHSFTDEDLAKESIPPLLRHPDDDLWYSWDEGRKILFLQYDGKLDPRDALKAPRRIIREQNPSRIIIDLRHCTGGEPSSWNAALRDIKRRDGGFLIVLVGRRTFAGGVRIASRLQQEASAFLLGEPTGSPANYYEEIRHLELPYSGLRITYPTAAADQSNREGDSLYPDRYIFPRWQDYKALRDRAYREALTFRPEG